MYDQTYHQAADRSSAARQRSFTLAQPTMEPAARRAARRWLTARADVEDVVAETMARAFAQWDDVEHHPNRAGWAYRCAQNVCREHARSSRALPGGTVPGGMTSPDEPMDETVAAELWLHGALATLTPRQRTVAVLRYMRDLSESETAARLGVSKDNVRAAAREARQRLREALDIDRADGGDASTKKIFEPTSPPGGLGASLHECTAERTSPALERISR